jgi:glycosyltransferase involved in cell wall biosynthesis
MHEKRLRILLTIHSLTAGGAEKFFTNIAQALAKKHEVHCFIPRLTDADPSMLARLNGLPITSAPHLGQLGYKIFYKLRQLLCHAFNKLDIELALNTAILRRLHHQHQFHIINTHLYMATQYSCHAMEQHQVKIVESDHGHYAFSTQAGIADAAVIFRRLDALVYPAASNASYSQHLPWHTGLLTPVIPYGYSHYHPQHETAAAHNLIRIGMAARGVEQKGWLEALNACRLLRASGQQNFTLTLVGEGPCIQQIRDSLSREDHTWLTIIGHVPNPEEHMRQWDIGLLPTFLPGESLPNTIIEYLHAQLAIITTSVGGIPDMISTPDGPAGILLTLDAAGRAPVLQLAASISTLVQDSQSRQSLSHKTLLASRKFAMSTCVASYEALFTDLLQ